MSDSRGGDLGAGCGEERLARELVTYKDSTTRSVQIAHGLDPDGVMGGECCSGEKGGVSAWSILGSRKSKKLREDMG